MKTCLLVMVGLVCGCVGEAPSGIRMEADSDGLVLDTHEGSEAELETTELDTIEPAEIEDDGGADTASEVDASAEVEVEAEVIEEVLVEIEVQVEVIEEVVEVEAEVEAEVIEEVVEVEAEVIEEVEAEVIEEVLVEVEAEVIEDTVLVDTNPIAEATPEVSPETELVEEVETVAETIADTSTDVGETEVGPVCPGECALWTTTCSGSGGYKICVPDEVTGCGAWGAFIGCQDGNSCSNGACVGTCTAPEIMFVVDRSSSMLGAKWDMTRTELLAFVERYGHGTRIGLRTFPTEQTCAAGHVVPLATDNGGAIDAGLQAPNNASSSPLAAALEGLGAHFGEADQGERVVLVSDGSESCADVDETIAAAVELRARGTIVDTIGIGMNYDTKLLTEIATAGGGVHRSASTRVALEEALADIAVGATGCERSTYGGYCQDGVCVEGCSEGSHLCDDVCVSDTDVASCGDRCSPCPTVAGGTSGCVDGACTLACGADEVLCDGGSACCSWNVTQRGKGAPIALTVTDEGDVRYFQRDYRPADSTTNWLSFSERKPSGWSTQPFDSMSNMTAWDGVLTTDGGAWIIYAEQRFVYVRALDGDTWSVDDFYGDTSWRSNDLAATSDGKVHAVTQETTTSSSSIIYRALSPNGVWGGDATLASGSDEVDPHIAVGPNGQMCAVWLHMPDFDEETLQIACRVNGVWSELAGPGIVGWSSIRDVAFDSAGNLHVLRSDPDLLPSDEVRSPSGTWSTATIATGDVNGGVLATDRRGELRLLVAPYADGVDQLYRWSGSAWVDGRRLPMDRVATPTLAFEPDNDPTILYSVGGQLRLLELVP